MEASCRPIKGCGLWRADGYKVLWVQTKFQIQIYFIVCFLKARKKNMSQSLTKAILLHTQPHIYLIPPSVNFTNYIQRRHHRNGLWIHQECWINVCFGKSLWVIIERDHLGEVYKKKTRLKCVETLEHNDSQYGEQMGAFHPATLQKW